MKVNAMFLLLIALLCTGCSFSISNQPVPTGDSVVYVVQPDGKVKEVVIKEKKINEPRTLLCGQFILPSEYRPPKLPLIPDEMASDKDYVNKRLLDYAESVIVYQNDFKKRFDKAYAEHVASCSLK